MLKASKLLQELFEENKLFKPSLSSRQWLLLGSPVIMDPHISQQHAGLQHTEQEETRTIL